MIAGIEPPIDVLDNGVVRNAGALTCTEDERPHAYHLVPRGVSKAQAIELDLALRGLGPEQAAAIGDSATDIEMADSVAVMALVANAFDSAGVRAELAQRPRANVWRTCCERGDGWAEFARAWLSRAPMRARLAATRTRRPRRAVGLLPSAISSSHAAMARCASSSGVV